ncbi:MAG: ATP-binding protein [Lentisphaeria bacterium]|jgi:MinD superfamily P-loop ATPase
MKELAIVSGKGGTGKTSVTASFAALAGGRAVLADCDVDAADLHLILAPTVVERQPFRGGHEAVIRQADCIGCGACLAHCRFEAVRMAADPEDATAPPRFTVEPTACEGCGACVRFCPVQAIAFPERECGEWRRSETRFGPLLHAQLGVAAENSGKLVSLVRRQARRQAEATGRDLILSDGPPGIGCPVIAALTGATLALAITEPTVAGEHDLERLLALARHFRLPVLVSVNKWDLNPAMAAQIEAAARRAGARIAGRIRYDRAVTTAQIRAQAVVEGPETGCAQDIRQLWATVLEALNG